MKTICTVYKTYEEWEEEGRDDVLKLIIEKEGTVNVEDTWWDDIYDDAKQIGLKLTSFDLDRNNHASGNFLLSASEVAANILSEHGAICDTYKTATSFLKEWQPVFDRYMDSSNEEDYESVELGDQMTDIEDQFLRSLLNDYATMLQKEFEYLQTDREIKETIISNQYEYDEFGNRL